MSLLRLGVPSITGLALITLWAMADEPTLPGPINNYPENVLPVSLQREIVQALPDAQRRTLGEWAAQRLGREQDSTALAEAVSRFNLRLDEAAQREARSLGAFGSPASGERRALRPFTELLDEQQPPAPFDQAFQVMLEKAGVDTQIRFLVDRPLQGKQRDQFLSAFDAVEFSKIDARFFEVGDNGDIVRRAGAPEVQQVYLDKLIMVWPFVKGGYDWWQHRRERKEQEKTNRLFLERLQWIKNEIRILEKKKEMSDKQIGDNLAKINGELEKTLDTTYTLLDELEKMHAEQAAAGKEIVSHLKAITTCEDAALSDIDTKCKAVDGDLLTLNFKALQQNQNLLRENLILSRDNATSLAYMKMAMYGSLSTEEKLKWLKDPRVQLPITDESRQQQKVRLERMQVAESVDRYLEAGNGALNALEALHVDKDVVRTGREVVKRSSQANKVFKAVVSGDPLAIVGAVFGLFGGGPDANEVLLQEMREQFQKVHEELAEVRQDLKRIEAKIDDLARLTVEQHQEVLERLDYLANSILVNREILLWLTEEKRRKLATTIAVAKRDGIKVFRTTDHYAVLTQGLADCRDAVSLPGELPVRLTPGFKFQDKVRQKGDEVDRYMKEVLQPSVTLFERLVARDEDKKAMLTLSGEVDPLSIDFLSPEAACEYATLILDLAPFRLRINNSVGQTADGLLLTDDNLRDTTLFKDFKLYRNDTRDLLRRALYLVNVAIVQQKLVSGELWLPQLARQLSDEKGSADPAVVAALKSNPVLCRNLTLYLIRSSGVSPYAYSLFLQMQDPYYLTENVRSGPRSFTIARRDIPDTKPVSAWHISLAPGVDVPMPDAGAVDRGLYLQTAAQPRLLALRNRLATELAALEVTEETDPKDRELLWALLLK